MASSQQFCGEPTHYTIDYTALQIWTFFLVFPKAFCAQKLSITSGQVFTKKGVETPKNSVFDNFCKIVELNTEVLEPSLLSEIDN